MHDNLLFEYVCFEFHLPQEEYQKSLNISNFGFLPETKKETKN